MRNKRQTTMFKLVEHWLSSGVKQSTYARQQKISTSIFNYWIQKYRKLHSPPKASVESGFIELAPQCSSNPPSGSSSSINDQSTSRIAIKLPNGCEINIYL